MATRNPRVHRFIGRTVEGKSIFDVPIVVGSLFFNDSNQFLQFPREGVINILDSAAPFTIEAWIRPTSIRGLSSLNGIPVPLDYGNIIIGDTQSGGNNWSLQLFNNKLTFYRYNSALGGPKFFTSNNPIPLNTWTHIAVSYDGISTLFIFINGVLDATFGDYSPPDTQFSVITIGNLFDQANLPRDNGTYAYQGYITNLRINNDQCFYHFVSPFKPAAPLGYISGTTLLLLANQNEVIKDSSPGNTAIANVGSVSFSSQYPAVADCSNNDAKVLMVGWFVGPRALNRQSQNFYDYGNETLSRANAQAPWTYANLSVTLATSLNVTEFPWQASWPSPYTATKVCPGTPMGISVGAIGQQVIVSNLDDYSSSSVNGTYNKDYQGPGIVIADGSGPTTVAIKYSGPLNISSYSYLLCFVLETNNWVIGLSFSDENASWFDVISTNPSSNQNLIPTMGWSPSLNMTAASSLGLPVSIMISGAVAGSTVVNKTYNKTNQAFGYLAESTNSSYNYYSFDNPNIYITSPSNRNTNDDYNYEGWVIAFSADGAVYFLTNPSTDKFNFPTAGWLYARPAQGPNSNGQSGPASITITAVPPSGIPVASTNAIIISNIPSLYGDYAGDSVTCTKYNTSAYSNPAFGSEGSMSLEFLNNQWVFNLNYLYDGEPYNSFSSFNAGISSIIPTVGWGPIAINITAVPPMSVSTTSSINLFDPTYSYQSDTYLKVEGYNNFTDDGGITTTNQFGQTINGFITTYVTYFAFNVTTNRWEFGVYEDSLGEGTLVWSSAYPNLATNPSTNRNVIPTTGWSRSLTITAGFPDVASTNQMSITNIVGTMYGVANNGIGVYIKGGVFNGTGANEPIRYTFVTDNNAMIYFDDFNDLWVLSYYNGDNTFTHATNPSVNRYVIPTTGWSLSMTITAAPSTIAVASTASVTIANYTPHPNIVADNAQFFTANTTYTKMNNLEIFYGYAGLEVRSNGGVCYKTNLGNYDMAILLPPNVSLETVNSGTFYDGVNKWRMAGQVSDDGVYIGLGFYVAGSTYDTDQYILQNDSTDATRIPTTGWYVFDRTTNTNLGASSITIT